MKNFQENHIGLPQGGKNAAKVPQPAAHLPYPQPHKLKEISLDTHTRLQILLIVRPEIVCIIGNVLNLTARTSPGVNMWVLAPEVLEKDFQNINNMLEAQT